MVDKCPNHVRLYGSVLLTIQYTVHNALLMLSPRTDEQLSCVGDEGKAACKSGSTPGQDQALERQGHTQIIGNLS